MIIEDFIMLGRTAPEESKKHGLVVCSAGYSPELRQMMRIYPLTVDDKISRWSICRVELKRNLGDSRIESWRLKDDNQRPVVLPSKTNANEQFDVLSKLAAPSIKFLNENRLSLGIIKPQKMLWRYDSMKPMEERQLCLLENTNPDTKKPRCQFVDNDGFHDLQIRDWGSNVLLSKYQDKPEVLWDALKFTDYDYEHLFFVGNMAQHRNNWLIISVISRIKKVELELDFTWQT